jgi:hypothetical protein
VKVRKFSEEVTPMLRARKFESALEELDKIRTECDEADVYRVIKTVSGQYEMLICQFLPGFQKVGRKEKDSFDMFCHNNILYSLNP